jgi:hypothetical protein
MLRLGVAQPPELRDRERRDWNHAGSASVFGGTHLFGQVPRRLGAAGVVPEQSRSDHPTVGVEGDHAVLLARYRDGRDVIQPAGIVDCGPERLPPQLRIDFGPVGMGGPSLRMQCARLGVSDDDLAALGRGVYSGNQGHGGASLSALKRSTANLLESG